MTLLADESVEFPIVMALRFAGHLCDSIWESEPSLRDEAVLERALDTGVPLLTADKDFGELVFHHERHHAGVILIRLRSLSLSAATSEVVRVITDRGPEMPGRYTVISPGHVRIRDVVVPINNDE